MLSVEFKKAVDRDRVYGWLTKVYDGAYVDDPVSDFVLNVPVVVMQELMTAAVNLDVNEFTVYIDRNARTTKPVKQ